MVVGAVISSLPVIGQTYGLTKTAVKVVANATSPTEAVVIGIQGVLIDCTPPVVKYPLKCAALACSLIAAAGTGFNPFATSLAIGQVRSILMEEILE